jgi:subtilisin family serine protease
MDSAMVVGSTILAQFQAWVSNEQADSIIALYGGEAFYPYGPSETVYAIRNLPATGISTLDLANIYNNLPESRYAHPEFGVRMVPFSYNLYDYYSINQDNIKKVIGQFNQASVWDFHGVTETIRVGLIDDGVAAHEDLPASRLLTSIDADYFDNDGDASPGPYKGHGMACVGILAASHTTDPLEGQSTTSGIISMAPNVEILPIKIASSSTGEWGQGGVATYAIRWAIKQGCNVISCSWGWPRKPDLDDDQGVASLYLILDSAYSEGIPIFFPSGNFTYNYVGYPGNHPKTFAVGASDLDDYRWSYSQYGLGLDVVAPSGNHFVGEGIWTLDQMGAIGRNPNVSEFGLWNYGTPNDINYNCLFDGTSAAVPIVSGTAALILSFDSTLGVNECTTFYGTPQ